MDEVSPTVWRPEAKGEETRLFVITPDMTMVDLCRGTAYIHWRWCRETPPCDREDGYGLS
jgi:hypothetical protein